MKTLCFFTILILSLSSRADYIKGGLGASLGGQTEVNGSGAEAKHQSSFIFPLIGAYGWELHPHLAIEGEFAVRHNEYKNSTGSAQAATLGANVVGSFPFAKLTVSGGAGPTYGLYKLAGDDKDFVFGAQAFAGLDYRLQSSVRLGFEYRYFRALQDVEVGSGITAKYTSTAFILNAKFPF